VEGTTEQEQGVKVLYFWSRRFEMMFVENFMVLDGEYFDMGNRVIDLLAWILKPNSIFETKKISSKHKQRLKKITGGRVYVIFGSDASNKLAVVRKFFVILVVIVSVLLSRNEMIYFIQYGHPFIVVRHCNIGSRKLHRDSLLILKLTIHVNALPSSKDVR
jgi:hypothetical protein